MPWTPEKVIPAHGTCDCCGETLEEKPIMVGIDVFGANDDNMYDGGGRCYSRFCEGAYCPNCAEKLTYAIIKAMPLVPCQEPGDVNDAIEEESKLISTVPETWER